MEDMEIQTIYIGGWFQRTTLHLTEIWNFLSEGAFDPYVSGTSTDISAASLRTVVASLGIRDVSRQPGLLECVLITTNAGIVCRVYEDGLVVLEKPVTSLKKDQAEIKDYYENKLSKAFSLLFSKGAPVPKELAAIKSIYPFIVTVEDADERDVGTIFSTLGQTCHSSIGARGTRLYRGHELVVINGAPQRLVCGIVESEIFFREFKSQLHRYLGIHRQLWESIAKIKERSKLSGSETSKYRSDLADYQKTINLIDARIDQMGAYVRTRQKVAAAQKINAYLDRFLEYKFETLLDTHEYVRYLWDMTQNYLNATIAVFDGLQNQATQKAVSTLQLVTLLATMNVILTAVGKKDSVLVVSQTGIAYAILLIVLAFSVQKIITLITKKQSYRLKPERTDAFK